MQCRALRAGSTTATPRPDPHCFGLGDGGELGKSPSSRGDDQTNSTCARYCRNRLPGAQSTVHSARVLGLRLAGRRGARGVGLDDFAFAGSARE